MATMFVRHQVTDYDAWRRVYDDFAPVQQRLGVVAEAVYRGVDDPNEITVTHEFDTPEAARAFAASDELREAMHSAGVEGAPNVWLTNRS
jgi:hypothetical protein